jgi:hypothetical protein
MLLTLAEIPEAEDTPLVRQLVEIIRTLQERHQQLEDEIARLNGLKTRPVIAPSRLETPPRQPPAPGQKRPGSEKRAKTAHLTVTKEVVVRLDDKPPGAIFKGYEDFVVQDLIIEPRVIRYRRERWQTPGGQNLVAPSPPTSLPAATSGPP